jgi:predicted transcriptional regulator
MALEGYDLEASVGSAKEEVRRILEQIPDNASFEDIQYHIYVREKIERGLNDVEEGRVLSQEEVERRMRHFPTRRKALP